MKKGDALGVARIAAIQAAKRTGELIPLCHPLPISSVDVQVEPCGRDAVSVQCTVRCTYATGVEMEALCAASVGALTIYDMCKAVDRAMVVDAARLLYKSGGKSGVFDRAALGEVLSVWATGGDGAGLLLLSVQRAQAEAVEQAFEAVRRAVDSLPAMAVVLCNTGSLQGGSRLRLGGALLEIAGDPPVQPVPGVVCWRAKTISPGGLYAGARIEVEHD